MIIGLPKETKADEPRVALTPEVIRKLVKKGYQVSAERGAGNLAGFMDSDYEQAGALLTDTSGAYGADIVVRIHRPNAEEMRLLKKGAILIGMLEPYQSDSAFETLASLGVDSFSLEWVPRTSRAQSMDVLSSQANIAGYRAVVEAASRYGRFFPLMMTSAGSAKPAKVIVLGAGVAGLQAIATAKRLGALVESYDIRPEVKEQIESLGAKFVELELGEQGTGQGGYAKELSEEAKKKQQQLLTERLKRYDVIISTANIPGRKAPVLITEEAVMGMRRGSVIVDMAAANGGNCPLSEPNQIVQKHGVFIVGTTNYPGLMPADSSNFYGHNLMAFIGLLTQSEAGKMQTHINLEDDIVAATLITYQGALHKRAK